MGRRAAACKARPVQIGVARLGAVGAERAAAWSRRALDAPLAADAVLAIGRPTSEAIVLGAFQRAPVGAGPALVRRISGGASAIVGPGSLWVTLALSHPSALIGCSPAQIVNRYVRPLRRALTKLGAAAHYFGRDWISVAHRPAGLVGFAHDSASSRSVFEAIVAVSHPFASAARESFRGSAPGTLASITDRTYDLVDLETAVVDAYASAYARAPFDVPIDIGLDLDERNLDDDATPWLATVDEAIGPIGAGPDARGVFRIGGDLMVSRDALRALEERALEIPPDEIPALVNSTLGSPEIAIDGVRDLASVARAIQAARLRLGESGS
jgi:hypothetical protein